MTRRSRTWLIGIGGIAVTVLVGLSVVGYVLANRFEPYVREQVISYLERRFDSQVELAALRVRVPRFSPVRALFRRGRGVFATVEGDGVLLRHKGRRDLPPMFLMKRISFQVDLGALLDEIKVAHLVTIDGMEINVPPKGERPQLVSGADTQGDRSLRVEGSLPGYLIEEVIVTNAALTILPKDGKKRPLRFDIHRLRLESTGTNQVMKYDAALTNAKPLGEIQSAGTFGPWAAGEPGDTPIDGAYRFVDADLGVFSGIAGILQSSGRFKGSLSSIRVQGEATVPDELLLDGQFEISQGRFLRSTIQDQIDTPRGDHLSITLICRARLGRRSCRQL